ncbi:hypothetical protein OUZ56_003308 [Daphnia magna]|uniref:Uncharacterized protein n=1 Tax=Daphnia magna TaxID=35525 RepID=A0ABR0A8C3_9CRUS|nr:hypothetical protein OUZ56_003308 [Daphnia magna]
MDEENKRRDGRPRNSPYRVNPARLLADKLSHAREDLLIELRQTRQTKQRETTGTVGDSIEEGATARSRHSSSASAATTSCETRDELTAERYTLLTELMGAALVVKSSRDKGGRRVNKLKTQTRHERIKEITRKLAEISTAEERVNDREQLDIALSEMVVLDQLVESQKRDSAPTNTTLVNRPALPLPVFNGEIAAWGSWKAAWSTYRDDASLSEEQKY